MRHVPVPLLRVGVLVLLFLPHSLSAVGPEGSYKPSTWLHGYLLQGGPMIGHVSDSTAAIWLRAKHGSVIMARAIQGRTQVAPARRQDLGEGFHLLRFSGLAAATPVQVRIELSREGDATEREEISFRTAPAPAQTGRVRLAFGSCSKISQYSSPLIYEAIADEQPDFSVFVGDNIYFIVADGSDVHFRASPTKGPVGDWNFLESMVTRHLRSRTHPDLRRMWRTVPSYGVWDDHDYGPNNADATFELREEAARAFRRVWANPSYGTEHTPGIFSSFRHGPVEVFLMDDRYHKLSTPDDPETGRIWGEAQMEWLLDGLRASTAPVKLIANGTQFLSLQESGEGHYQQARGERRLLLEFVAREKIGGIVFLSGDRHFSEAMQQAQPDGTLVVECCSSPLNLGQKPSTHDRPHANQLWSMRGDSYGLVTVDIPEEGRGTIRFEARDSQNQLYVIDGVPRATTWTLDQLSY